MPENTYFKILPNLLPKNDIRYIKWKESLNNRSTVWNKGKTKDTDSRVKNISDTFKRKKINNFSKWRLKAKLTGLIPDVSKPLSKNIELAFLYGIILGDGNITKMARTECLTVTLGTDKPKLWKYVANIVEKVFNKKPTTTKRHISNCINVRIYQNQISKRLNITSGARKDLEIKLPEWIWKNKKFLIATLKGLFEAEASLSIHLKTYTYNFSFSNKNVSLLNEVQNALTNFGLHPERRINAVRLRRKKEVDKFRNIINFRSYP